METVYGAEANKVFIYFLKAMGITEPKFKKINNGYRTYKGEWLFDTTKKVITRTNKFKDFNGYDYDVKTEESVYQIVKENGKILIKFLTKKIF